MAPPNAWAAVAGPPEAGGDLQDQAGDEQGRESGHARPGAAHLRCRRSPGRVISHAPAHSQDTVTGPRSAG